MRGRPGCPTGQEKNSVGATGGSPLFYFYKERLGTGSPLPVCETTLPSPPSRWAGRYGRRMQGRRPVLQKKKTPLWPPTRERWVQGGENLSPPWCSFLRLSSKESRAPARGRAGNHLAGANLRRSKQDHLSTTEDPRRAGAPPGPTQGKHCSQGLTSPEFVVSFKS